MSRQSETFFRSLVVLSGKMVPADPDEGARRVLVLVSQTLGVEGGEDLALRLGWISDRGGYQGRKARNWLNYDKNPPGQFSRLLDMLSEAGLLLPPAQAAWMGTDPATVAAAEAEEALRSVQALEQEPPEQQGQPRHG